ncbi:MULTISPECIES: YcaO-like family protein [unclassified Sinorhizobium]|uniref:YcaO-like family protein n=1 Tax=unclassified Sinorhizobium TaxID=2613772 RepID=UPI0024C338C2|nr:MULTISPECIES: YcaO-like family protein [unclassified Sinorhizobium]MDK1378375.1 YcaO-like family protein [Sinorhizobium sp. 6-70]MDK1482078.1 YcaO-like family protein [Sinorhizobium sp. 6-117]
MRLNVPLSHQPASEELEHCLRAILPLCRRARISRLGDLTGLDRIGLPVIQAVRPAALSEVTSLGRGFSKAQATVGAVMEALERYYAESIPAERIFPATADELEIADGLFENLLVPERREGWRRKRIPWIAGLDVASGDMHPVPLELVHTRYTDPPPAGDGLFLRTTTGLACHTSASGAFAHGLLECIERDAIARAFATHGFFDRMRIATSALGDRPDYILSVAGACGISFALWLAPSPASIPVVWCQTIEAGRGEPILALPTEGYAAGQSVEAAAASAMLEALAARAGAISGARDDQTREHYRRSTGTVVAKARALILDDAASTRTAPPLVVPDLRSLMDQVITAGLGPILAVPVGADDEAGVHCVRTVLPRALSFFLLR